MSRFYVTIAILGFLAGCSDLPPELNGTWRLDVSRTVERAAAVTIMSDETRNTWTKQLEEQSSDVTYLFDGDDFEVQAEGKSLRGQIELVRAKERRFTLDLKGGDARHQVRVWFEGPTLVMEEHRQTMVLTKK
jgi:hypothetical protein